MEPALGITASGVATFRPLFRSCGFGGNSRGGHLTVYELPEQHPGDAFAPATNTRAAGSGPSFDAADDKNTLDGSEHELTVC